MNLFDTLKLSQSVTLTFFPLVLMLVIHVWTL